MDHKLRRKLIDLARINGAKISYQALSDEFQLQLDMKTKGDRMLFSRILEEISEQEYERGRPILSSLVLPKGKIGKQTDEYYKFCETLGLGNWEELKADPSFEEVQRKACYEFWRNDTNYKSYKYLVEQ
ncbi:MAG: hypothetical protein R3D00_15160 [Bacteroidia bacterium]